MSPPRPEILVVDDREENLIAVRTLMRRLDAEVVCARSGNEALALTLDHEFAVILLDVRMPDMDGYEVAGFLRDDETTRNVPIIFVTAAYKDEHHRHRGYREGAVDYIEKPIDETVLLAKISVFLDLFNSKQHLKELLGQLEERNQALKAEVAERQRAETALAETARVLERSNEDLEQFAYAASHDLQEPLRMVTSYLGLLRSRYADRLDADADEFIRFAVDGARRMSGMIKGLLDFSRIGRGDAAIQLTDCDAAVREALANLANAIEDSGAEVSVAPLPEVMADPAQLVHVFQNLIVNAIKYRAPGRPPRVRIEAAPEDRLWRVSVVDNGIGIEPEDFERVFQIFKRLHGVGEYEGAGIGLSIVKKIVERGGGRISVESVPGEGSTFHVFLPAAP